MLKELHLVARTIYTFVSVLALSAVTGLSLGGNLMFGIGVLIFINSFVFQYFVLHWALKNVVTTPRGRNLFLLGWLIAVLVGIVLSSMMIPSITEIVRAVDPDPLLHQAAWWGSSFVAFSAAFVALTCTRRTWTRHGKLG